MVLGVLFEVFLPMFFVFGLLGGIVFVSHKVGQRRKNTLQLGIERAYAQLGFEPPVKHEGDIMRSTGAVADLRGCFVDTRFSGNGLTPLELTFHVPAATLKMPKGLTLEVTKPSNKVPPNTSADAFYLRRVLSTDTTLQLSWGQTSLTAPIDELFSVAMPKAYAKLAELDAFYTEPLTAMKLDEDWLILKRNVMQSALDSRSAKAGAELELYTMQLVQQTAELARAFAWEWDAPEELWEAVFMESEPFTRHREEVTSLLFHTFRGTPAAERIWRYALDRGNLYDVVFAINHDQERALAELSDERFVTFVNTLVESSDSFDLSALPNLAARRFDFSALLNTQMSWEVRKSLLLLWLSTVEPDAEGLRKNLGELPTTLRPNERRELISTLQRQPSLASAAIAPVYAAWARSDAKLDDAELSQVIKIYKLLAGVAEEDALSTIAVDVESLLLALVQNGYSGVTVPALDALAHYGGPASIPVLTGIIDRSGQTLVGQGSWAKLAREAIVERYKRDPTSGGLSVSAEAEHKGAISSAQGEAGGLALLPPPGDEP